MRVTSNITYSVSSGQTIKITIPVFSEGGRPNGCFPDNNEITWNGVRKTPINGFFMDDDEAGSISELAGDDVNCLGVYYTHNSGNSNKIIFRGLTLEEVIIHIQTVPIHDHSSISQGGPAHGTYYSEYDIQEGT